MQKKLIINIIATVTMLIGAYNADAEMCGCMDRPGDGMHEEGMPRMQVMRHQGMGVMEMDEMMDPEHPMWGHLMGLGLDEKQREAIKEIKSRVMKEMVKKRADERVAGIELKDILDKDHVDMKTVENKLKQIEILKTEMHLSLIRAREEIKSKLTPEQRKKFKGTMEMRPMTGDRGMMGGTMRGGTEMNPPSEKMEHMRH
jgi:Spy/CpxP family protein refolding chaperone